MKIISVKHRIAFALAIIMLSSILTGVFVGLGPNERGVKLRALFQMEELTGA